jgi:two-component system, response regulator PdtaR
MFPDSLARILVVDPDEVFTSMVAAGLRAAGHTVVVAAGAASALAAAGPVPPDLLLVEAALQPGAGLALAAQLRDRHAVPFMVVSEVEDRDTMVQAANLGSLGWLAKPLVARQVLAAVTVALARAAELRGARETEESLERALGENRAISLATGVLMERLRVDRAQAFEALRDDARMRRERIGVVAEELLLAAELINGVCSDPRRHAAQLAS